MAVLVALVGPPSSGAVNSPSNVQPEAQPAQSAEELYSLCAFYPKPGTCEEVYHRALSDNSISAQAVKAEYQAYARYLGGSGTLTDADRQYLRRNGIRVPDDLTAANRAGLHNLINDPALPARTKPLAVNGFISRAVQAELYCSFNSCAGAKKNIDMAERGSPLS